jgi:nitric oxide reductase subunit C
MARPFLIVCLLVSGLIALVFISRGFAGQPIPDNVAAGYVLWRSSACVGCHTLYGQGGTFAPDLTHIYAQRGESYLREFFVNPNAFHPDQRLMPRFGFTVAETDDLLVFLDWVDSQSAAAQFPPRPILVSGSSGRIGQAPESSALAVSSADPVARGRELYSHVPAICSTCHSLEPDIVIVGPSLYGIAQRAAARVAGMSAEDYIRASILQPSDYVVEGFQDVMQKNFADVLSSQDIDDLIAFLMTQEASDDAN